jgi:hypothetical protein
VAQCSAKYKDARFKRSLRKAYPSFGFLRLMISDPLKVLQACGSRGRSVPTATQQSDASELPQPAHHPHSGFRRPVNLVVVPVCAD